ncbi:MAG: adenylosuccinate lyase [Deltaproteobacteria bacterium]|nr:adenylosuccinate lyase [Deltaproteobacteria bacterium]
MYNPAHVPRPLITDVLATRYASRGLLEIWSPYGRVVAERDLWIAVMKAQRKLGVDIPAEAIEAYEKEKHKVDLDDIAARERELRHDVKARIESFCAAAGFEHIHKGMTSRDLTDNVEQLLVRNSMALMRIKTAAGVIKLCKLAAQHQETVIVGRTHNVPAQPTTLGKRLAMFAEELLRGYERLESTLESYPLRGIKGAVGTRLDQLSLLGDPEKVDQLEAAIARELGFERVLDAVGQVYPRSLDFEVLSALYQVGAGLSDFARTMRLMTGQELASEGFKAGQVGSSAMPHKMNARNCERINGFHAVLAGYMEMTARLAGDQWNEGDVSCSVTRRVALPGAFFAMDGMLETFLTVLAEMEIFPASIAAEVSRQLPFLATTTLLMEGVKAGGGRETLHEIIKGHSVEVARGLRSGKLAVNDLAVRLGDDPAFPLDRDAVQAVLGDPLRFLGDAPGQVRALLRRSTELEERFPGVAMYEPDPIL